MKLSESLDLKLPHVDPEQIKPGAIWEISRRVQSPLEFDTKEQQNLYPDAAQNFLTGNSPPRYVMIVNEPESPLAPEEEWRIVCVMLLSVKTDRLSDVDILIPSQVSGLGQDLLAETWNVLPMLTCNLSHFVGRRLSRQVYDVLLDVGDYYNGLIDEPPTIQEIQLLGLQVGALSAKQQPEIQAFHQQESDWAAILQEPVAAFRTYIKTMKVTEAIFDIALQLEQELSEEFPTNLSPSPYPARGGESFLPSLEGKEVGGLDLPSTPLSTNSPIVHLSQWFQNTFETGWHTVEELLNAQAAKPAFNFRKAPDSKETPSSNFLEIAALIDQLHPNQNELHLRQAIKKLGEIGTGNSEAINVLTKLLSTTQDEETLWTAVESLWRIDSDNPATGIRRVKPIDLGRQPTGDTVALTVALIQKRDLNVGILLRLSPIGDKIYLPPDLKLILLDKSGKSVFEVTARRADAYIQLKLTGQPGEQFGVRVALGDTNTTENFMI
jgi:hypothetical protein